VCDGSHIFRVGGRVAAFRLGLIGLPMRPVTPDRRTSWNPQTRSSHHVAGVATGGSLYGSILQSPVAWCKMYLVIESKTHKITRHLGQKAKAGVLATARGLS